MLYAELLVEVKKDLPVDLPVVFISSLANQGISELKDLLWKHLH
jgi:GTP-binding protein